MPAQLTASSPYNIDQYMRNMWDTDRAAAVAAAAVYGQSPAGQYVTPRREFALSATPRGADWPPRPEEELVVGGQPAPAVPVLSQLNQRIDSKVQREREAATRPVYHVQADKDPNVGRPHADPPAMTEAVAVKQTPSRPSVAKQTEISESVASVISTPESSLVSSGPVLQMRVSSAQKGVRSTEEQAAKARRKEEQEKSLKGKSWKKRAAGRAAEEAEQAAAQRDSVEAAQTSGEDSSGPSSFVPSAWREVTQPGAPATEDSSLGDMLAFGAAPGGRPVRTEAILQLVLD